LDTKTRKPNDASTPVSCPAEQALNLVANKWAVHVIFHLSESKVMRFRDLQRSIGEITQKELTKQLRRLERFGLVDRRVFPEVPPRVEYRLTRLGATLVPPLVALSDWSSQHGKQLEANRKKSDVAEKS
jgi:DNA-binding HxlR family transcriptional regulator